MDFHIKFGMTITIMTLQKDFTVEKIDKKRHLAKALSWSNNRYVLIAWIITGKIDWAAGIASIEVSTKRFSIILEGFGTNILNLE